MKGFGLVWFLIQSFSTLCIQWPFTVSSCGLSSAYVNPWCLYFQISSYKDIGQIELSFSKGLILTELPL